MLNSKFNSKFPALGWGLSPPSAGEVVRRMISHAQASYEYDRRQLGHHKKPYPKTVKGYFRETEKWEISRCNISGGPAMPDDDEDLDEDSAADGFSDPASGGCSSASEGEGA